MPSYQVNQIYPPMPDEPTISDPRLCVTFDSTLVMRERFSEDHPRYKGRFRFSVVVFGSNSEDRLEESESRQDMTPPELAHYYGREVALFALRELFEAEELFDEETRMRPGSYNREAAVAHIAEAQAGSPEKFENWASQVWYNLERQPTPEEIFGAAGGDPDAMATALYLMQNYDFNGQEAVEQALEEKQAKEKARKEKKQREAASQEEPQGEEEEEEEEAAEAEESVMHQVRQQRPNLQILWVKDALGPHIESSAANDVISKAVCLHEFGGYDAEAAFQEALRKSPHCRPEQGYDYDDFRLPTTADTGLIRDVLVPWVGQFPNPSKVCRFVAQCFLSGAGFETAYKEAFGAELTADNLL